VAAPDINFSPQVLSPGFGGEYSATQLTARLVSDVDGDGARDLVIFAPYNGQGICGGSRAWFVRSAFLKTASASVIDISPAPTPTAGFTISGWDLADVIEGADFDGDGHPTLLFTSTQNAIFPIDASDFGSFTPAYPCATPFASPFDPSRWRLVGTQ